MPERKLIVCDVSPRLCRYMIISISYGIGGAMITVAMLSLALNLLPTEVFIVAVKKNT